jgi:hypothetical protein
MLLPLAQKDFWSIMNRGPLLVSLLCLTGGVAHGEDLLAVYDRALLNDPQIREAEATRMAAMEARPQALANLLPQFSGTGNRSRSWSDTTGSTTNVLTNNTTQQINTRQRHNCTNLSACRLHRSDAASRHIGKYRCCRHHGTTVGNQLHVNQPANYIGSD